MEKLTWLLSSGFLKGYRTYVLSAAGAVTVIAAWAVGDQSSQQTMHSLWELAVSLSVGTVRAGMNS